MRLSQRQLTDLECLINGTFAPLKGFLNEADYLSVVKKMRLENGTLWPIPITLDISTALAPPQIGDTLKLLDQHGSVIALLAVESVYKPDKMLEARQVFGTDDRSHPGVQYLLEQTGDFYVGGTVTKVQDVVHVDFLQYRMTPAQLKSHLKNLNSDKSSERRPVIGFQTRNPMHRAHFEITQIALNMFQDNDAPLLLIHPVIGPTKPGDIDYHTRVKCYEAILPYYGGEEKKCVHLALLNLCMRMAGPREALWHAMIRKNYGCTHFIVGRDHAGCGNFYGEFEAQNLCSKYEKELGITILPIRNPSDIASVSGTMLRALLHDPNTPMDSLEKLTFFPVAAILRALARGNRVYFFTGLSGAGKTTLAHHFRLKLLETYSPADIVWLDGDIFRREFPNLTQESRYDRNGRNENVMRMGYIASLMTAPIVIVSALAPFQVSRDYCRQLCEKAGKKFLEIYVSTPLSICQSRDPRGHYARAQSDVAGTNSGGPIIGIHEAYETPTNPDLVIDSEWSIPTSIQRISSIHQ